MPEPQPEPKQKTDYLQWIVGGLGIAAILLYRSLATAGLVFMAYGLLYLVRTRGVSARFGAGREGERFAGWFMLVGGTIALVVGLISQIRLAAV